MDKIIIRCLILSLFGLYFHHSVKFMLQIILQIRLYRDRFYRLRLSGHSEISQIPLVADSRVGL